MFTESNVNTLVSWLAATIVFLYGGSHLMGYHFRKYYRWLLEYIELGIPPMWVYGLVWVLISAMIVASMTLWTMFYEYCNNTYYIVIVVMALTTLVFLSAWAPLMIRAGNARAATWSIVLATCAAIAALVLMALNTASNEAGCRSDDRTPGILACIFWGVPIIWYIVAIMITWRIDSLGSPYQYKQFKKHQGKDVEKPILPRWKRRRYRHSNNQMELPLVHDSHLK
jgi:tryptophan-rich sensory protein